jgi:EcoRII C terminal
MAAEIAEKIETDLHRAFQERIPKAVAIAERAVHESIAGHEQDAEWIKANFSTLIEAVHAAACDEYQEAQQEAARAAFCSVLLPLAGENATPADVVRVLGDNFYVLDRFFVGLTHARRPHAAKAFELLICKFLAVHYAGAAQPLLPGQPDFILPSVDQLRRNPADTIIFSIKKTVRDRWRHMIPEGTRPLGFFLATTDEEITPTDLSEMKAANVHVVVPARVKLVRTDYESAPNVLTFEKFFAFHLDPAVERWLAAGVLRPSQPNANPEGVFADASQPELLPPGFGAPRTNGGGLRHRTVNLLQSRLFD